MKIRILSLSLFIFCASFADTSPDHHVSIAEEYAHLGDHFDSIGKQEKAIELYTKALSLHKDNPHALVKLGNISYAQQDTNKAIQHYEQAVQLQHEDPHMHFNLGLCYQQQNAWQRAAEQFKRAIALDPTHLNAHLYAGSAYEKLKQHDAAIEALKKASELDPHSFEAWHQLGNLYRHVERLEDAVMPYRKAAEQQPNNLHVMMDLANTLNMLNQNEESLELYQQILAKNPNAISALYNFGFTLKKMDKLERAIDVYEQVLAKKPDYAAVHFSLASIYLALGNLEKGWEEYEWRWKAHHESEKRFNIPVWQGEDLADGTLLVYAEQGLGDTLQFIRYLKALKEKSSHIRVIFETQSPLAPLLKLQPYIDQVVTRGERVPHCHYQISLMSLPYILKTRLDTIPADIPYLTPDKDRVAFWKEKLSQDTNFKIGICWQGNARYSTQALRRAVAAKSLPVQAFKSMAEIPGVSIYSLQQVDGMDQIASCDFKNKLIFFDETFDKTYGSFMDSAAVMQQLDLVVSVDTGVCHLAGAMGVPTWILLPFPGDWRWLRNRTDSPWYPSVRLFRQQQLEDWDTPMQDIVASITDMIKGVMPTQVIQAPPQSNTQSHQPTKEQKQFFEQIIQTLE